MIKVWTLYIEKSIYIYQWFSTGGGFAPPAHPGDIWQCLATFLVVTTGKGKWHLVGRGWLLITLQCTEQPLKTKNYTVLNVNSVKFERCDICT